MKKFLVVLVVLVGFGINANAQSATCKVVNPSEEGATIVADVGRADADAEGYAYINLSSDEPRKKVNVTIVVTHDYSGINAGGSNTVETTAGVPANETAIKRVYIGKGNKVTRISISGARCVE